MTNHDEKILYNLKFSHESNPQIKIPLKLGNNVVLSHFFPDINTDKLILFNIIIGNDNQAYLRTFDHFPLIIKFNNQVETREMPDTNEETNLCDKNFNGDNMSNEVSANLRKQTLINFNSILNIQIFPTNFSKFYFSFEKVTTVNHVRLQERFEKNEILMNDLTEEKIEIIDEKANNPVEKVEIANDEKEFENNEVKVKEIAEENYLIDKEIESMQDLENNKKNVNNLIATTIQENVKNLDKLSVDDKKENLILIDLSATIDDKYLDYQSIENEIKLSTVKEPGIAKTISSSHSSSSKLNNKNIKFGNNRLELGQDNNNILPRKIQIIDDDDIIVEKEGQVISASPILDKLPQSIRLTRSNSSSLLTSNIIKNEEMRDLLERKRRRPNKEDKNNNMNTNIINNLEEDNPALVNKFENNISIQNNRIRKNKESSQSVSNSVPASFKLPCSICLDPINNPSRLDGCEHEFCKECIDQWSVLSNQCPLCKNEFKKIIYWDSNNSNIKLEKKVRKRRFKYEEEEDEPWYNNCDENCMVCNKNNDEHLLLVCDKCMFKICHTYCAGLDLIPDEDWICSNCINEAQNQSAAAQKRRSCRIEQINTNTTQISNLSRTSSNIIASKVSSETNFARKKSEKVNISVTGTTTRMKNKSLKNEETKNINIPISYKLDNNISKKNSLNLNVNVNFQITNSDKKSKKNKTVTNLPRKNIHLRHKNKKYNLRNSRKK